MRKRHTVLLWVVLVMAPVLVPAQNNTHTERIARLRATMKEGTIVEDLVYREDSGRSYTDSMCRIDLYVPEGNGFATIVWLHGGGLSGGSRQIPAELTDNGYAVAGVGYRLSPRASTEEIIDDAAAACAWIYRNIRAFGGDPSRIYLTGHSAGGYLITLVGLDKSRLEPYGLDPDTCFRAMIPYSGQAITHYRNREEKGLTAHVPLIDRDAPLFHVRADAVPVYIISGDRQTELYGRYEENAYFWRMFQVVGHPDAVIHEVQGFGHGDMVGPGHSLALKYIRTKEEGK